MVDFSGSVAVGLAALLIGGSAQAAPKPSLLGVELGQPLPGQECREESIAEHFARKETCWRHVGGPIGDSVEFDNPGGMRMPDFWGGHTSAVTLGGLVAEVDIMTTGVDSETAVMGELRAKFGKPSRVVADRLQNRFGAKFVGVRAWWKMPGYTVTFDATESDLDHGLIKMTTPEYDAAEAAKFGQAPHL